MFFNVKDTKTKKTRKPVRKRISTVNVKRGKQTAKFKKSPAHVSQQRFLQATQVYVMHNIPIFWLNKFGISDHSRARSRNVSETTAGYVFHLFAPTLEYGWHIEQFVHRFYKFQNVHFLTGSGRTEWFVVFSPIVGTAVLILSFKYGISLTWKQYALAYFTPFVWLDGWLWLLIFWLGRVAVIVGIFFFAVWVIAHAE